MSTWLDRLGAARRWVLVVGDDPGARRRAFDALEALGHQPIDCRGDDAAGALALAQFGAVVMLRDVPLATRADVLVACRAQPWLRQAEVHEPGGEVAIMVTCEVSHRWPRSGNVPAC